MAFARPNRAAFESLDYPAELEDYPAELEDYPAKLEDYPTELEGSIEKENVQTYQQCYDAFRRCRYPHPICQRQFDQCIARLG